MYRNAVFEGESRVTPRMRLRGHVALHARHELVESIGQFAQESEDFAPGQLALHHHEAHEMKSKVTANRSGRDGLSDPRLMSGPAGAGQVINASDPATRGAIGLDAKQAASLKAV